jgi:hypothetical protein
MNNTLVYKGIEHVLLAKFPELRERLEKAFGSYYDLNTETPEAYPVFEDVLQEFLFDLLDLGGDDAALPRIFSFLEEMANSPDRDVTDLLCIAILEPLVFRRHQIRSAWRYMGPRTKKLAQEIAHEWGWLGNLPTGEPKPPNGC